MVSRLLESLNEIFRRDTTPNEVPKSTVSDLDNELEHLDHIQQHNEDIDLVRLVTSDEMKAESLKNESPTETGTKLSKTKSHVQIYDTKDTEDDLSLTGSPLITSATSITSDIGPPPSLGDLGDLNLGESSSMSKSIVSLVSLGPQPSTSRPMTRRSPEIEQRLSDVSAIPVGLLKTKRSTSEHLYRIPCEIASQGEMFFGPTKGNINVDAHSNVPVSVSTSTRPFTATERMIYGMSEMQDFVSRPTSTPEFLELSMMVSTPKKNNLSAYNNDVKSKLKADIKKSTPAPKSPKPNSGNQLLEPSRRSLSASSQHSSIRPPPPRPTEVLRSGSSSSDIMPKPNAKDNRIKIPSDASEWKRSNYGQNRPVSTKSSSSILQNLNDSINEIMLEEDQEFRDKYSQWIAQIFHTQLSKMKSKLTDQFNQRLGELHEDKDREIMILHERYQSRLTDFEGASVKFQKWADDLEEDNRRVVANKDSVIEQMQMQLEEAEQNFELRLEKQQSHLKADAEHEKMELVNRHEDSVRKLLESRGRLEPLAKSQMESLHRLVSSLKSENSNLKRNLKDLLTSKKLGSTSLNVNSSMNFTHLDALSKNIEQLSKRLNETEREKTAISEFHSDEILVLKKLNEETHIDMSKQLQQAHDTIQFLKKKHDREIKDLKMTMLNQETKYNKTFLELKRKYGQKIENLTTLIDKIQSDFT